MNNTLNDIREKILKSESIAVFGHTSPDGDAISACLGLGLSLLKINKKVTVFLEEYSDKYDIIFGKELVNNGKCDKSLFDLFISLDCGDQKRLGINEDIFNDNISTINIDHHASNPYFGFLNFVEPKMSSTSEIVFDLIFGFSPIDENIANNLYAGILYDTGGFRHNSTSADTLKKASELVSYKINISKIYNSFFYNHTYSQTKILAKAIDNSKLLFNDKIIYSFITLKDIEECGSNLKELDEIVVFLKSVKNTYASVFLYEKGTNEVKASFRADGQFNVCDIAKKFGGGGHINASGCTIENDLKTSLDMVLNEIDKSLGVNALGRNNKYI